MNLIEIVKRVWSESGKQGFGPDSLIDANKDALRMAAWANDFYMNLARERDRRWKWLRSSVTTTILASQTDYSPTDLGLPTWEFFRAATREYTPRVKPPGGAFYPLRWMPLDKLRMMMQSMSGGMPTYWSIADDDRLVIAPAPLVGTLLEVAGLKLQAPLALDADVPMLPSRHHMCIVWAALVETALKSASPEIMAQATANLDAAYRDLIEDQGETIHWQQ